MGKNNLAYTFLIGIIIVLLISTGFFFYKSQQKSSSVSFLAKIADNEEYLAGYYKEIASISKVIDNTNYTDDYTSCMNWINKWGEKHNKYSLEEYKELEFLQSISVNDECNNAITKYSSLINSTKDGRDNWRAKSEKWCYGYHKVGWTSTWTEEYVTPLNLAYEELNAKEDAMATASSEARVICLKQLAE